MDGAPLAAAQELKASLLPDADVRLWGATPGSEGQRERQPPELRQGRDPGALELARLQARDASDQ